MSGAGEGQDIDAHEGLTEHEAQHYQQTPGCHKDGCSLGRSQADTDWESLMAGVYFADQNFVLENSERQFAAPDQATFDAVLAASAQVATMRLTSLLQAGRMSAWTL